MCRLAFLWFRCCQSFFFLLFFFRCRLREPLLLLPPPRGNCQEKKKKKGSFVVFFQQAGVAQVANYFVHRHLCCFNNMLIWSYCVRWKVEVPAVLLLLLLLLLLPPGKWMSCRMNVWEGNIFIYCYDFIQYSQFCYSRYNFSQLTEQLTRVHRQTLFHPDRRYSFHFSTFWRYFPLPEYKKWWTVLLFCVLH